MSTCVSITWLTSRHAVRLGRTSSMGPLFCSDTSNPAVQSRRLEHGRVEPPDRRRARKADEVRPEHHRQHGTRRSNDDGEERNRDDDEHSGVAKPGDLLVTNLSSAVNGGSAVTRQCPDPPMSPEGLSNFGDLVHQRASADVWFGSSKYRERWSRRRSATARSRPTRPRP